MTTPNWSRRSTPDGRKDSRSWSGVTSRSFTISAGVMCRDESDAEDLVQDTFLNVYPLSQGFPLRNQVQELAVPAWRPTPPLRSAGAPNSRPNPSCRWRNGLARGGRCLRGVPQWAGCRWSSCSTRSCWEPCTRLFGRFRKNTGSSRFARHRRVQHRRHRSDSEPLTANVKVRLHRARLFLRTS